MTLSPVTSRVLVVAIVLAATLPFLNKAFHIDDVLYLRVADQILKTPWDPYGYMVNETLLWDAKDGQPATLFDTDYNPPLWKYALAGMIAAVGKEEWKLHLLSMVVVGLAAWGLYLISARLTGRPIWCVVMVILSPFFLPGQNLMLEVPVLACVVWGSYFQWRAWDRGSGLNALMAGVFIGLAILTKYTIGLFLPLFFLGSIFARSKESQRFHWRPFLYLLPAAGILGAWCAHNLFFYGQLHLTSHGVSFKPSEWPARILVVFRIIGAVSVFGPIWWVALWRRGMAARMGLLVILLVAIGLSFVDIANIIREYGRQRNAFSPQLAWQCHLFTTLGCATIFSVMLESILQRRSDRMKWWRSFDDRHLELWVVALFIFNVCCVPFNAIRHLLVLFLAMTWLTARLADRNQMKILPVLLAVISIGLGYMLAIGDYTYAENNRHVPETRIRADLGHAPGVWYSGTWGFKYYAEREGAKPYFPGIERYNLGRPIPGDRVYLPKLQNWAPVMETIPTAQVVDMIMSPNISPATTIMPGANYYGTTLHLLPWGVPFLVDFKEGLPRASMMPVDLIVVYEVKPNIPRSKP